MYYRKDWILRQIEILINFIRSVLGKGENSGYLEYKDSNEYSIFMALPLVFVNYNKFFLQILVRVSKADIYTPTFLS